MNELERRALLGDKQAQEECTEKGIVLPCPFCGGSAELIEKDGLYSVACKDGTCIASDIHPEYGEAMVAISDWNTRPAPPIGRCDGCVKRYEDENGVYFCDFICTECGDDDFCSRFEPKEREENERTAVD